MNTNDIIKDIKKRTLLKKVTVILCFTVLACGMLSFLFYGLDRASNAIKFISKKDQISKVEKIMLNPKIKFEQSEGQFFDIEATKAIHKDESSIEMFDVKASGNSGSITSGNLLITNSGNNLHFSNNPVLTIIENGNE